MNILETTEYLLGLLSKPRRDKLEFVLANRTRHITVVLEDIYQEHNASATLRSAELNGIQDIHVIENKWGFQSKQSVDMGSAKWLTLNHYNLLEFNTPSCFENLKNHGYQIIGTSPNTEINSLDKIDISRKTAIVFGTEKKGLSEYAIQNSDMVVKIPMYGFTDSYNISVTVALMVFNLTQELRNSNIDWALTSDEKQLLKFEWAKKSVRFGDELAKRFIENSI